MWSTLFRWQRVGQPRKTIFGWLARCAMATKARGPKPSIRCPVKRWACSTPESKLVRSLCLEPGWDPDHWHHAVRTRNGLCVAAQQQLLGDSTSPLGAGRVASTGRVVVLSKPLEKGRERPGQHLRRGRGGGQPRRARARRADCDAWRHQLSAPRDQDRHLGRGRLRVGHAPRLGHGAQRPGGVQRGLVAPGSRAAARAEAWRCAGPAPSSRATSTRRRRACC
jgi:hypothetical protein